MSSVPSTAKALLIPRKQAEFIIGDVEVRKPQTGEILIRIHATSLNPIDWKVHKWGISVGEYPVILGNDIAGEVAELGEGVTDFEIGDRVYVDSYLFLFSKSMTCDTLDLDKVTFKEIADLSSNISSHSHLRLQR